MSDPANSNSSLCLSCGLCCDGTLFAQVLLAPEELASAEQTGFRIELFGERSGFRQPCSHLCGTSCGVYAVRPAACRNYRCTTLQALEAGEIGAPEAGRRVASARQALARVEAGLRPGETVAGARERIGQDSPTDPATPQLKLALGVLDLVLDRYFRKPRQRRLRGGDGPAAMGD